MKDLYCFPSSIPCLYLTSFGYNPLQKYLLALMLNFRSRNNARKLDITLETQQALSDRSSIASQNTVVFFLKCLRFVFCSFDTIASTHG